MVFVFSSVIFGTELEVKLMDKQELAKAKRNLVAKFNSEVGEKNPKRCTFCAVRYASNKVFQIDTNRACLKCILERYSTKKILNLSGPNFQYKVKEGDKAFDVADFYVAPYKDGFIPAQFGANIIFSVISGYIYTFYDNKIGGEDITAADRFGATTRAILPCFFGSNAILTIVHGFTKYWERLKEFPLSIRPKCGPGFQLGLSVAAAIAYWGSDQKEFVGDTVLIYGCIEQLLFWVGQNIPLKLHDRSFVNDYEFGIQKAVMWYWNEEIPQDVLNKAWVPGSSNHLSKAVFALSQGFVFLNLVSAITLCLADTKQIGFSDKTLGIALVTTNMLCWIAIMVSVLVGAFGFGRAHGPVLSWNVFTRIVVVSMFAGMNAFQLPTKMAMNMISIVLVLCINVFKDMFETIYGIREDE